ncbi:hypothetical protein R1flu_014407 [Riccia fluitans]|uniref:Uncharacterized protein n=1 Tax=Riccia fluitans TaxID=41844 RepID=A0ABD1YGE3_9MARC
MLGHLSLRRRHTHSASIQPALCFDLRSPRSSEERLQEKDQECMVADFAGRSRKEREKEVHGDREGDKAAMTIGTLHQNHLRTIAYED